MLAAGNTRVDMEKCGGVGGGVWGCVGVEIIRLKAKGQFKLD